MMYFYAVLQPSQAQKLANIWEFGVEELFQQREAAVLREYDERLRNVKKEIDVLGLGQRAFLRDHQDDLSSWSERARIRILLLDPKYPSDDLNFANQRDGEEQDSKGKIRSDVIDFLKKTSALRRDKKLLAGSEKGFGVRLYRALPTITIFRVDGALYWGPYLMRKASRYTPMIRVAQSGVLYQRMIDHFDAIWNSEELSCEVSAEYDVCDTL